MAPDYHRHRRPSQSPWAKGPVSSHPDQKKRWKSTGFFLNRSGKNKNKNGAEDFSKIPWVFPGANIGLSNSSRFSHKYHKQKNIEFVPCACWWSLRPSHYGRCWNFRSKVVHWLKSSSTPSFTCLCGLWTHLLTCLNSNLLAVQVFTTVCLLLFFHVHKYVHEWLLRCLGSFEKHAGRPPREKPKDMTAKMTLIMSMAQPMILRMRSWRWWPMLIVYH